MCTTSYILRHPLSYYKIALQNFSRGGILFPKIFLWANFMQKVYLLYQIIHKPGTLCLLPVEQIYVHMFVHINVRTRYWLLDVQPGYASGFILNMHLYKK